MALIADDQHVADDSDRLAREALAALDRLLGAMPRGEALPAREIAALVRLINRAFSNLG